jgi:hypothetical protein
MGHVWDIYGGKPWIFFFAGTVACIVLLTNLFDDWIPTQNWCLLSSWAAPASGRRKGTSKWKGQTTGTSQDGSWHHGNVGNWGNQWSTVMVYEVPLGSLLEVLENYDAELQLWFTEAVCLHQSNWISQTWLKLSLHATDCSHLWDQFLVYTVYYPGFDWPTVNPKCVLLYQKHTYAVASMLLIFSYMKLYFNIFCKENMSWVLTMFGLQMLKCSLFRQFCPPKFHPSLIEVVGLLRTVE